jgi:[acyl-carrier-protein] S-malonyltransferase
MLALLFPGQGSQEVGMGRDACEASEAARATFQAADATLGFPLSRLCFEGLEEELRRTEIQQPAILTASVAILRALEQRTALSPAYLAGHSLGEYTALVAAGSLEFENAVALVHARGRFMQEAVSDGKGAMAAILGCSPEEVVAACQAAERESGGVVAPANFNSPQQTVISGDGPAVELAGSEARRRGAKRVLPLAVSAPFHCSLMEPAAEKLAGELGRVHFADSRIPVVTNVEARPNSDGSRTPELLRRQVTAPVRFTESVQCLADLGVTRLLEVGPGRVLSGLVARIDRSLERLGASTMSDVADVAAALKD